MTNKPHKTLVIGLDGATFDVLVPLIENGHMPFLEDLMNKGGWGRLASTVPPFTAAAWSSLITGQNPGQHGIISFSNRDRFNYGRPDGGFVNAQRFTHTLWEILGRSSKRVSVVNVPLTYPARPVNGNMITGMLTPPGAPFTFPADLEHRLGRNYMIDVDFIRDENGFRLRGMPPKNQMLSQIRQMSRVRAETCLRLLQDESWDFFMVVFTGTDRVLHFFWDELSTVTTNDPSDMQKELLSYFHELDESIRRISEQADPSANILLMSDHGFGPAPTRRFYVNVWLEQMGLLKARGAAHPFDLEYWRVQIGRQKRLKSLLRRLLPQATQDAVQAASEAASEEIFAWSRTEAYFVPIYFHVCGVDVNLKGERREGIVSDGDAYEALRDQIILRAREVRDPLTNQPVVTMAVRREELYHGSHVSDFPDVILVLDPDYIGAGSLAGRSLFEPHPEPIRSGEHREDGIFIGSGPDTITQEDIPDLKLIDVPATILYMMGVPIPSFFDGRALTELFQPSFVKSNPVVTQHITFPESYADIEAGQYTEDETAQLENRLRGLGYME